MQKEDRLSFCINLEVVELEIKYPTFVFWEKLWLDNLVSRLTDLYQNLNFRIQKDFDPIVVSDAEMCHCYC